MLSEYSPWVSTSGPKRQDKFMPYAFRTDQAFGRGGLDLYKHDWMTNTIPIEKALSRHHENRNRGHIQMVPGPGSVIALSGLGDGIRSFLDFQGYWDQVKDWVQQWNDVGQVISEKQQKMGQMVYNLLHPNYGNPRPDVVAMMQPDIDAVNADMQKWWVVKGYIDKYLPDWLNQDAQSSGTTLVSSDNVSFVKTDSGGNPISGLGIIPLILGAAAIAGLAFTAVEGLRIWKTYSVQSNVLDAVKAKTISTDAAQALMAAAGATDNGGSLTSAISSGLFGMTGGISLTVLGIAGVWLYLNFFRKAI